MNLRASVQHGRDQGNSYTSSDVASQVHQAGSGIVFVAGQESVGSRVNGDKQKRHARGLEDAGHGDGAEVHVQVKAGHMEQRTGEHYQAEDQQPSRAIAREQESDQGQQQA